MSRRASPYRIGDLVHHDSGQIGRVVWSLPRKSDGQTFVMVQITDGPREGQRVWPWGWVPQLDWPGGTVPSQCGDCQRPFKATTAGLNAEIWCRTCAAEHDRADDQRAADTKDTWRDVRWKREDRGRGFHR
jgi:hypothetical protein